MKYDLFGVRRVARIWKRGGAFLKEWENCKRPWPEFSLFLNQNHTVYPKIETEFLGKLGISKKNTRLSPNKKKKGLHRNWYGFFGQNRKFKRFFRPSHDIYFTTSAPNFFWGELFSFFHQKSASKAPKTCDFAYFTGQWGGGSSPPPPWLRYSLEWFTPVRNF